MSEITPEEELEIHAMPLSRSNRSFPDKTVLWKAKQLRCTLLTCDNKPKVEAISHGLEVHGSIWVLTELVEHNIISKPKGVELLGLMKSVNTRLPIDEIDKLIKQLK